MADFFGEGIAIRTEIWYNIGMKSLLLVLAVVLSCFAFGGVCKYCSGHKMRTLVETCPNCKGKGVLSDGVYYTIKCPKCEGITHRENHPYKKNQTIEVGSGKIKKRVPCDMCRKYKEMTLTPADLEVLTSGGVVTNGAFIISVNQ